MYALRRSGLLLCVSIALACAFALVSGCADEDTSTNPGGPRTHTAWIHGTILRAGVPFPGARIEIRSADRAGVVKTQTDSAGTYEARVGRGRYRIVMSYNSTTVWYAAGHAVQNSPEAETIVIGPALESVRADFRISALHVVLDTGQQTTGTFWCDLVEPESGNAVAEATPIRMGDRTEFEFPLVAPGRYLLRIRTDDRYFWLPPSLDREEAEAIEVTPEAFATRRYRLDLPAQLRGVVTGAWVRAGARPVVEVFGSDSLFPMASQVVNVDGSFSAWILAPGRARLRLLSGDVAMWVGGRGFVEARTVLVAAGGSSDVGTIATCGVLLRFSRPAEWQPSSWSAWFVAGDGAVEEYSKDLDHGEAVLPLTRTGAFRLLLTPTAPSRWRPQWFDRASRIEDARTIVVDDGNSTTEVTVMLEAGGSISGRSLDAAGSPLVRCPIQIRLATPAPLTWSGSWKTGEDGSFQISGLPDGEIRFAVLASERWVWYPGVDSLGDAEPIRIVDAGEIAGLELRATERGPNPGYRYVGGTYCKMCHMGPAKGAIYETWAGSAHARAYDDLDLEGRLDNACLACHTTGFDGPIVGGRGAETLRGVQCEACHGPGSDYKSMTVMKDPVKAAEKGLVFLGEDGCRTCHRSSLPQACWGGATQTPAFDFEEAWAAVAHSERRSTWR